MADVSSEYAIAQFVRALIATTARLTGSTEIFAGCEVTNIDSFGVGVAVLPRYITARINEYTQPNVHYRGFPPGIQVADRISVVHIRDGDRYEALGASGAAGISISFNGIAGRLAFWSNPNTLAASDIIENVTGHQLQITAALTAQRTFTLPDANVTIPAGGTLALASGIAGGQTIYGGTAANDDLTLIGTSHATKTTSCVLLQPGGVGYVGILTANPTTPLGLIKNATIGVDSLPGFDDGGLYFTASGAWDSSRGAVMSFFGINHATNPGDLIMYAGTPGGTVRFRVGGQDTLVCDGGINVVVYRAWAVAQHIFEYMTGNHGVGTVLPDRLLHTEIADAVTAAITYAKRTTHITSGTAAALFGVGEEHELEDGIGVNQVASEVATLWADPQNTLESPLRRWTTYPKGAIGPAYGAFWTRRDVDGTAVPVVPNGTGDVTAILRVMYVIELIAGGNTLAGEITALTGGGAVDLYNAGGEQFTITVAADGSVSVVRAAGADSANIGLWMIWI